MRPLWGRPARAARRGRAIALAAAAAALVAGCGDDDEQQPTSADTSPQEQVVVQADPGDFNAAKIYQDTSPGVVTILSVFGGGELTDPSALQGGQGSGFVVSEAGEIVTNAHVVTSGGQGNGGGELRPANQVFVEFADGNRVPGEIAGFDADVDIALVRVDPDGLDLSPVPISKRDEFAVGEPVAAIGSPFGEDRSLSVGIVSATDRTVQSLTRFAIDDAIQTDASINPGNSGGPLIDSKGEVIGINQQIETASGSSSGVGFAIPVSALRYSLPQLRESGEVRYAFIGVTTTTIWPQLSDRLEIDATGGALISEVVDGSPADDAGLRGAEDQLTFQGARIDVGGDVILSVDGEELSIKNDLAEVISTKRPGETVELEILRDGERQQVSVDLEVRPERAEP